jgi:NADH-quinone oxidoreductase subunit G
MTVMTGHNSRRYRFASAPTRIRIWALHQPRDEPLHRLATAACVITRITRWRGSRVYGAHDNVYFGRVEDGTLESEFSGNLVEVCPTGVFTDKTHSERYNRKWDMQFAPASARVLGRLQHQPG